MKKNISTSALLIYLSIIAGCGYFHIGAKDSDSHKTYLNVTQKLPENNTCIIMGKVTCIENSSEPVLIYAHPLKPPKETTYNYNILDEPGEFILYLPKGKYHLYCITDKNNNSLFEGHEVSGFYGKPDILSLTMGDVVSNVTIESGPSDVEKVQLSSGIKISYDYNPIVYQSKSGNILKIYDGIFSKENGVAGFKAPSLFMKVFGANIYLTEKYDPKKIPILFVHGAQGTPQDWAYFLFRLDTKKYQPFFFYYPSGVRLQLLSKLLYEKLNELFKKYKFNKMCLVAHSMGGLITYSMLTQRYNKTNNDYIKVYMTFATPWSGFKSADFALTSSPFLIPSWIDVASRSSFIRRTLKRDLPETIDYYLFYGKFDSTSKGRALDERVFKRAIEKYSFDTDHNNILSNRDVFFKFEELLNRKFFQ